MDYAWDICEKIGSEGGGEEYLPDGKSGIITLQGFKNNSKRHTNEVIVAPLYILSVLSDDKLIIRKKRKGFPSIISLNACLNDQII